MIDQIRADTSIDVAYRGVPALVLGGSGFIGAWTIRALHARGAAVTAAARDADRASAAIGPLGRDVRVLVDDLEDPRAPGRLVDMAAPAIVFNLAGYGVDRSERSAASMTALNACMVETLCAKLAAQPGRAWPGLRLVHVGSALEYGRLEGSLSETVQANPTTDYGRTKLQGTRAVESCCAASGLSAVVARLFTVYGPGEHSDRLLPALMRTARTGIRLPLTSGRQRRSFTYVEDVAEGLLRLGVSGARPGAIVNLATGSVLPVREFAETAAAVLGIDPALLDFGALPDREDEMWHGDVDVTRLRSLTSWMPSTSIAEGIRRTWESINVP
ncbi:MAG TPA: NAD(P)-dependent oxidoreductase [Vicinamibacterales bacterium]|nr:NAD(P)-dependent oxidoreductase [Vicinamibacterales bacterium]